MRLNEIIFNDAVPIDAYGPGFFRIGGKRIDGPVAVFASGVSAWGGYEDVALITDQAGSLDVLFVGTGAEIAHLPKGFREAVEAAGIGVEIMASPAACRNL